MKPFKEVEEEASYWLVREDRGLAQASGDSGYKLPEEFRAGLDEYFNRLERPSGKP